MLFVDLSPPALFLYLAQELISINDWERWGFGLAFAPRISKNDRAAPFVM